MVKDLEGPHPVMSLVAALSHSFGFVLLLHLDLARLVRWQWH
jgi:hypothetical protein